MIFQQESKMYQGSKRIETLEEWKQSVMEFLEGFQQFAPRFNEVRADIIQVIFTVDQITPMGRMRGNEMYTIWYDKHLRVCSACPGELPKVREKAIN